MTDKTERHRKIDTWWARTLLVAIILGFVGQGLLTWRTVGIVENDIKHLTTAVKTMQTDIKDLFRRAYWTDD